MNIVRNYIIQRAPSRTHTMASWSRLVRFQAADGVEKLGDLLVKDEQDLANKLQNNDLQAVELQGTNLFGPLTRGNAVGVQKLLPVLRKSDVPIIRCIGLNYMKHSEAIS